MADAFTEAVDLLEGLLHKRRGDLVRQVEEVDRAIASMATIRAIGGEKMGRSLTAALAQVASNVSPPPSYTPYPKATPPSVYQAAIELAEEADREWGTDDFISEFKARGITFEVTDLQNSLFSALSRAFRNGVLIRTGAGRYRAAKFNLSEPLQPPYMELNEPDEEQVSGYREAASG